MGLGKLHLHVLMRNVGLTGSAWWHILKDEVLKLLSLLFMVAWEDAASTCVRAARTHAHSLSAAALRLGTHWEPPHRTLCFLPGDATIKKGR